MSLKRALTNGDRFLIFINTHLVPYFIDHSNSVLIMDNARFHKTTDIQQALRNNSITCKYIVPYSPELNPIEEFFSMLKSKFHARRIECPALIIEECLTEIFVHGNNYSSECQKFYANMRCWLDHA